MSAPTPSVTTIRALQPVSMLRLNVTVHSVSKGSTHVCASRDQFFLMDSEYSLCICLYGWRFRDPKPPVSSSSTHLWIPLAVLDAAVS